MTFRKLQHRISAFFLTLLALILITVIALVHRANLINGERQIMADIQANAEVLASAVRTTSSHLLETARLLSSDYAFKRAYATRDGATILSAMRNHLGRVEQADLMLLINIEDDVVIADTRGAERSGVTAEFPALLENAANNEYGEAAGFVELDDELYQLIVVPLFAPDPIAWIAIGFRIDDSWLRRLRTLTNAHITLATGAEEHRKLVASTLPAGLMAELGTQINRERDPLGAQIITLAGETFVSDMTPLAASSALPVAAIVQRSLDEAMAPYRQLKVILLVVFLFAIAIAFIGGTLLARRIARPLQDLTAFTGVIEHGDYSQRAGVSSEDEVGTLSRAFNHMVQGLEEKDRMRDLLGKVVSPEIAHELMHKGVELGGEEKEVTILFSDLRNFTTLCEGRNAHEVLSLLNLYLDEMSHTVEQHNGVVDKYIGDAMMALYGAPLISATDADNAVATALAMSAAMVRVNERFATMGLPAIEIGIGINTDRVVAGNMGSANRLNYTVIGDGVNLASRLEGLNKFYGTTVVVSESTRRHASGHLFRELDRVRVKGKQQAIAIFQPYSATDTTVSESLPAYGQALQHYRDGNFTRALEAFSALVTRYPEDALFALYRERCGKLIETPPTDWDGISNFSTK